MKRCDMATYVQNFERHPIDGIQNNQTGQQPPGVASREEACVTPPWVFKKKLDCQAVFLQGAFSW